MSKKKLFVARSRGDQWVIVYYIRAFSETAARLILVDKGLGSFELCEATVDDAREYKRQCGEYDRRRLYNT